MDAITYINPSVIRLPRDGEDVRRFLTYTDKSIQFQVFRLQSQQRYKGAHGWIDQRIDELKSQVKQVAIWPQEDGSIHTYSGLAEELAQRFGWRIIPPPTSTFPEPKNLPWAKLPKFELWPHQKAALDALLASPHGAVSCPTGCHAKGTEILMYDGTIRLVEDIRIGDLLMGPDSQPRKVLNLHRGRQEMARIVPTKGEPFVVNLDHILSLKRTTTHRYRSQVYRGNVDRIINISVREYLKESKNFKHIHKLYRTSVEFKDSSVPLKISPYILGAWLGDGSSKCFEITTMDSEIAEEFSHFVDSHGGPNIFVRKTTKPNNRASTYSSRCNSLSGFGKTYKNPLNAELDFLGVLNNKHIPYEYLTASREDRLQLLAGLIDTDGYYHNGYLEITQKSKKLAGNIVFLSRSLGFAAYTREVLKKCQTGSGGIYYSISISGNIAQIPTRLTRKRAALRQQIKDVLVTGFDVEIITEDDYFGFEVDNDHLYVMGDFTVTHNSGKSACIVQLVKHYGLKTIIATPSSSISEQLYDELTERFGVRYVGMYGAGKKKSNKLITIAVAQALTRIEEGSEAWEDLKDSDMFIFDEAHATPADTFEKVCMGVAKNCPYRYFFSATHVRNDGSELILKGVTGPIRYAISFSELVEQGILARPVWKMFSVPACAASPQRDAKAETRNQLYKNPKVNSFAADIANKAVLMANRPTVILIEEFSQFVRLYPHLKVPFVFAHGGINLNSKDIDPDLASKIGAIPEHIWKMDSKDAIAKFVNGEVKLIVGTSAISTGVDLKPTQCLIYLQGGTSEIKVKQAIGRGTRMGVEGKTDFWVVDFLVNGSKTCTKHALVRKELYEELMGTVDIVGKYDAE
jgi:hypothetical protein